MTASNACSSQSCGHSRASRKKELELAGIVSEEALTSWRVLKTYWFLQAVEPKVTFPLSMSPVRLENEAAIPLVHPALHVVDALAAVGVEEPRGVLVPNHVAAVEAGQPPGEVVRATRRGRHREECLCGIVLQEREQNLVCVRRSIECQVSLPCSSSLHRPLTTACRCQRNKVFERFGSCIPRRDVSIGASAAPLLSKSEAHPGSVRTR